MATVCPPGSCHGLPLKPPHPAGRAGAINQGGLIGCEEQGTAALIRMSKRSPRRDLREGTRQVVGGGPVGRSRVLGQKLSVWSGQGLAGICDLGQWPYLRNRGVQRGCCESVHGLI